MPAWAHQIEAEMMGEISRRLIVTGGGITDQLVREGLVTREPPANDCRAFLVKLTRERRVAGLLADSPETERRQLHALLTI